MAAPNAFTNELEKWVYQKCIGSIVFVDFHISDYAKVWKLWNNAVPIPTATGKGAKAQAAKQATDARKDILNNGLYCTGFVVAEEETRVKVLTCAHVLGDSFSITERITCEEVSEHFEVRITCDHHDQDRQYVVANVERISLDMDMILLSISKVDLHAYCTEMHTPIPMAPSYPEALETVVMVSWPPECHRTAASGATSHPSRLYAATSSENPKGYTCRLAQVDISSEGGSSGAPLVNGAGEFLCTLHGGFGGRFSYFISFQDVRDTLLSWGVLEEGGAAVLEEGGAAVLEEGGAA